MHSGDEVTLTALRAQPFADLCVRFSTCQVTRVLGPGFECGRHRTRGTVSEDRIPLDPTFFCRPLRTDQLVMNRSTDVLCLRHSYPLWELLSAAPTLFRIPLDTAKRSHFNCVKLPVKLSLLS